jgi:cyclomaltodextrinase / maltogenic alpha-amylase / neopullulanase
MKRLFQTILLSITGVVVYCQSTQNSFSAKVPPSWISGGIIYQVFLRSFTQEGTIKAAAHRLDNIAELGATIVYLSPVMLADTSTNRDFWSPRQKASSSNNPRNPYRIMDYLKVDPEYGTEKDLKEFIITAHHIGLRVIMDIVFWHSGPSNVLTKHPEFYQRDSDGKFLTNNYNFLVLNYKNKDLREYLINNMEYWIRQCDVDGFRCDVSGAVPLDFWEEARSRIEKIKPDAGMLAESNAPNELLKAFDVSYGFPWYNALADVFKNGKEAIFLKETYYKQSNYFPKNSLFIRYSDNHDLERTNIVFSEKGSKTVNVLNFMLDGVPFLYNGQEIGDCAPIGIWAHYPVLWEAQGLPQSIELRNWYKELISLRKNEHVLLNGKTIWLETDNPGSIAAFLRRDANEEVLTFINVSNRKQNVSIKFPDEYDRFYKSIFNNNSVKDITIGKGHKTVSLDSFGYFVGKLKKN